MNPVLVRQILIDFGKESDLLIGTEIEIETAAAHSTECAIEIEIG
jgi:hypothetical protein